MKASEVKLTVVQGLSSKQWTKMKKELNLRLASLYDIAGPHDCHLWELHVPRGNAGQYTKRYYRQF
jgi:hypothetical protein